MSDNFEIKDAKSTTSMVMASLCGVTPRYIQELSAKGIIPSTPDGNARKYNLMEAIPRYIDFKLSQSQGVKKGANEEELKKQKLQADIALKESQGELHRLKTSIASGDYMAIQEIKLDYEKFFLILKKMALSLPSRIAGRISNKLDPVEVRGIEKDVSDEINKTLTQFVVKAVPDE